MAHEEPGLVLDPTFKLVFLTVLSLTVLSLLVSVGLVLSFAPESPPAAVQGLIETTDSTFKMGFGAMVGLISGKAIEAKAGRRR